MCYNNSFSNGPGNDCCDVKIGININTCDSDNTQQLACNFADSSFLSTTPDASIGGGYESAGFSDATNCEQNIFNSFNSGGGGYDDGAGISNLNFQNAQFDSALSSNACLDQGADAQSFAFDNQSFGCAGNESFALDSGLNTFDSGFNSVDSLSCGNDSSPAFGGSYFGNESAPVFSSNSSFGDNYCGNGNSSFHDLNQSFANADLGSFNVGTDGCNLGGLEANAFSNSFDQSGFGTNLESNFCVSSGDNSFGDFSQSYVGSGLDSFNTANSSIGCDLTTGSFSNFGGQSDFGLGGDFTSATSNFGSCGLESNAFFGQQSSGFGGDCCCCCC